WIAARSSSKHHSSKLEPPLGFEPRTLPLEGACSQSPELWRRELGAPSWIQTSDLRLRRAALCSAELPEQSFPSTLRLERVELGAAGWTRIISLSIIGRVLCPLSYSSQIPRRSEERRVGKECGYRCVPYQ